MRFNVAERFEGSLLKLMERLFIHHYPKIESVVKAQKWLIDQISREVGPYPIRHSSDIRRLVQREGVPKPRLYFNIDFNPPLPFHVIASDNESSTSFFTQILNNNFNFDSPIGVAVQNQIFLGIARRKNTPQVELDEMNNLNLRMGMNNLTNRPSISGLKLCHLRDAGRDLPALITRENILQRSYLCLSLLNMFPFPDPKRFNHDFDRNLFPGETNDLGEQPNFQMFLHHFLAQKFYAFATRQGSNSSLELFQEHCIRLGSELHPEDFYRETIQRMGSTKIIIKPRDNLEVETNAAAGVAGEPIEGRQLEFNEVDNRHPRGIDHQRPQVTIQGNWQYPPGQMKLLRIGGGNYNDNFLENGSIIWEASRQALAIVKGNKYTLDGINIFGVWHDQKILGLYRFGTAEEVEIFTGDDIGERRLLLQVAELGINMQWPRGPVAGCNWDFPGIPL